MWGRVGALIVKELLAVWRDRRSRFVLIGPPIIQLFVFSYAATFDVRDVTLAILNEDGAPVSRDLQARFEGSPTFERLIHLTHQSEIGPVIDAGEAAVVVRLPQGFSRDLLSARPATVQMVLDGRMSNTAQIVQSYASEIIADFGRDWADAQGLPGPPASLVVRAWFNPNLHSQWVIVPDLVGLLTMIIAVIVTALSVARERELGTLEQLLVTPLRPFEIVLGKTTPALIIGLAEATIIIVAALLWFRVPLLGSVLLLYGSLVVFLLAVIGAGLFISSLAATQQQAILGAFLFAVPAIVLSGFATPIENMPEWLQIVTLANPIRHFLVIVQGLFLKDLPFTVVLDYLWPLAIIATVSLTGAVLLFRRRLA
jgi:ABC-2 type transport system permease protein